MDAIHYHVRSEGQIVKKAVYIAIGISSSGENESAKFRYLKRDSFEKTIPKKYKLG